MRYKWGYNPYNTVHKWVTGVMTLLLGVTRQPHLITGRNPHEVEQLNATSRAFSAIMADGKIVAWGSPEHGAMAVEVLGENEVDFSRSKNIRMFKTKTKRYRVRWL